MENSPKEKRDNLGASLRSEALGRDVEELRSLAHQVIEQGTGVLKSRERIEQIAAEIRNDIKKLLWQKQVMMVDLSPSLTSTISVVRAVYEPHLRRDLLDELIPFVIDSVNEILAKEDVKIKKGKGGMKGRSSARTMVRVRSISGGSKKSKPSKKSSSKKEK